MWRNRHGRQGAAPSICSQPSLAVRFVLLKIWEAGNHVAAGQRRGPPRINGTASIAVGAARWSQPGRSAGPVSRLPAPRAVATPGRRQRLNRHDGRRRERHGRGIAWLFDVVVGCGVACRTAVRHGDGVGAATAEGALRACRASTLPLRPLRRHRRRPPDCAGLACAGPFAAMYSRACFICSGVGVAIGPGVQGIAPRLHHGQRGYRGDREHGEAAAEA